MQLRNDINFLRAIAVILVVLYHFNIQGFSLGFIGVDIFFVISGFLMTKIIIEKLDSNTLNLFQFYKSRAIRLIPALFVMCLVVFIVGWFFLFNHEFETLSKHIFSSINFFSNFTYWKESGYFDIAAKEKILLHTWSLSLEWQFYLIYPILLYFAFNNKKSILDIFYFLGFLTVLSLTSLFYISTIDPTANFYLLPSRAWEFIAGGIIYIISKNNKFKKNNLLTILGYSILSFSILFSFDTLWPSYVTLIPIIGTALIILCQSNYTLYSNKIINLIGLASYSIYLWHWPIVYIINKIENTNNIIICISILLSFLIGIISYKLIEIPVKNHLNKKSNKTVIIYYFLCVGLLSFITFLGCISFFPNNPKQKKVESILAIDYSKTYRRDECLVFPGENFRHCDYGHGDLKFLVVGDSHSNAMLLAINNAIFPENIKVKAWSVARCSPIKDLKNIKDPKYICGQLMDTISKEIDAYPSNIPLFIISALNLPYHGHLIYDKDNKKPYYYINKPHDSYNNHLYNDITESYVNKICELSKNRNVFIFRPTPEFPYKVPTELANRVMKGNYADLSIPITDYQKRNQLSWIAQDMAKQKCKNIEILDLNPYLCDKEQCFASKNLLPLYSDNYHISQYGADLVEPFFKDVISKIKNP